MSIATPPPVAAPSPPVNGVELEIPFTTVFATVKLALSRVAPKPSVVSLESRVAAWISTSEGEFIRVGTVMVRAVSESLGKIW